MNGIFNTGLSFVQFIGAIVVLTISAIAVKITFNFDFNKFLERKDQRLDKKIKNTCPHVEIRQEDKERFSINSLLISPPGTHQWQCQRCGLVRDHNNDYEKDYEYWGNHLDEYTSRMKEFEKLLRKGGAL